MQESTILSAIIGLLAFCLSYLFLGSDKKDSPKYEPIYGPKYAQRPDYIGLTEREGKNKATQEGMIFRVISRDGEGYPITLDYRSDRINVAINDGHIVGAYYG